MPLLILLLLAVPAEPAALCAMIRFPGDLDPGALDPAHLDSVIAQHPDCMPAHFLRGFVELDDDDNDKDAAIVHFERALELAPRNSDVLLWLGRTYLVRAGEQRSLGDAESGLAHLEAAIAADPENLEARSSLAGFHRAAPWIAGGDIDVAYEQAREIGKRDPLRGDVEMARMLLADGEDEQGLALARTVLEQQPDNDSLAVQYAVLMHERENFADAHRVLVAATRRKDANLVALYQLGRTAALAGAFLEDGRAALERYLLRSADVADAPYERSAAWWRLGMIEEHDGKPDTARKAYEQALLLDPDDELAAEALESLLDAPSHSSPQE